MKLVIFKWFVCISFLPLFFAAIASAGEINLNQADALTNTCIKLLQNNDFKGAALLYHYPPGYSEEELEKDMAGVAGSLQIFAEEFGSFAEVTPFTSSKLYLNIYASGGTHAYWEQHPNVYKVELQTEFSNFGPGYLIIQFVNIIGTLELKAIAYGLPVSGESVSKIKQVGDRMLHLMKDHQAAKKKI